MNNSSLGNAVAQIVAGMLGLALLGCGSSSIPATASATRSLPGALLGSAPITAYQYSAGTPLVPLAGARAYRLTYQSEDHRRRTVHVTGALMVPDAPWSGPGLRPLVSFAIGTHGVGDACGPSYALTTGLDYEAASMQALLTAGYAVVATDYFGVGTDEPSTYINRLDQGHAVLDIVKAARQLAAAQLPPDGPVLIYGYSQGGEGAGSAIELQPEYAPELQLIGGVAGSVPSDGPLVVQTLETGLYTALLGNFINGLQDGYPDNRLFEQLSATGKAFADATRQECAPAVIAAHQGTDSRALFLDGRPLSSHLSDPEWKAPMADLLIGNHRPIAPVLVIQSIADDIVPAASTDGVVSRWCAQGVTVEYQTIAVPGHIAAGVASVPLALAWFDARVRGQPATNTCPK